MLEIHSLTVAYGERLALRRLSLDVNPGEILAVAGPNGAGKSTLIRAASGVLPIQPGMVRVDGHDLTALSPERRARFVAVVPQARTLPPAFTVYQTVLLGRTPYLGWLGRPSAADHDLALAALQHVQAEHLAERRVGELSGGEQQRILLARALAQDTPILLLDEPTTHLDLQHQTSFLNLVRSLAGDKRLSILIALHDLNLAGLYADRVALLREGSLYALGAADETLTAEILQQVYQIPVHVIPHPLYGTPLVLPDGK